MTYFVYIIRCTDGSLYTGITTDMQRRFREHSGEAPNGAKFTRSHRPQCVEALWSCEGRSAASKLEYAVKKLTRAQKLALIADNLELERLFGTDFFAVYTREKTGK